MACTHEPVKAMFSPQHTSDTHPSLTQPEAWFKLQEEITHKHSLFLSLPLLPSLFRPPFLLFPSPFCLHSSSQQCRVLLVTASWLEEALKPDSIVYVYVHDVVHTQSCHVEKYCPLHCPLLHLPFPHTHTH